MVGRSGVKVITSLDFGNVGVNALSVGTNMHISKPNVLKSRNVTEVGGGR